MPCQSFIFSSLLLAVLSEPIWETILTGFDFPAGIEVKKGKVYVAEGGTGLKTSGISRCSLKRRTCKRIVDQFPSRKLDEFSYGGISDLTVKYGSVFFITAGPPLPREDERCKSGFKYDGLPCRNQWGKLYEYDGKEVFEVADLSGHSLADQGWMRYFDLFPYLRKCIAKNLDSNPYKLVARNGKFYVSDAGANTVLVVDPKHKKNRVRTLTDLVPSVVLTECQKDRTISPLVDAVPTGLAFKDDVLYLSNLGGWLKIKGRSLLYKVEEGQKELIDLSEDMDGVVDLAWGKGDLYILSAIDRPLQQLMEEEPKPKPVCGVLRRLNSKKKLEIVIPTGPDCLPAPTGMSYYSGSLYILINGFIGGENGAVVKVDLEKLPKEL